MKYQFGAIINRRGFIMPTILAFIIITSGAVMYQTISTIIQLYGVQGEINDLVKWEYMVNTKRVVDSIDNSQLTTLKTELSYQRPDSELMIRRSNCWWQGAKVSDSLIGSILVNRQSLTVDEYQQIQGETASESCKTKQPDSKLYTLLFVDYQLETEHHRLLILDQDRKLIKNTIVN